VTETGFNVSGLGQQEVAAHSRKSSEGIRLQIQIEGSLQKEDGCDVLDALWRGEVKRAWRGAGSAKKMEQGIVKAREASSGGIFGAWNVRGAPGSSLRL
jgi:hypothetical protein